MSSSSIEIEIKSSPQGSSLGTASIVKRRHRSHNPWKTLIVMVPSRSGNHYVLLVGFDPEKVDTSRFGLQGIRERVRILGGLATIETSPGNGTRVVVELPLAQTEGRHEGRGIDDEGLGSRD